MVTASDVGNCLIVWKLLLEYINLLFHGDCTKGKVIPRPFLKWPGNEATNIALTTTHLKGGKRTPQKYIFHTTHTHPRQLYNTVQPNHH